MTIVTFSPIYMIRGMHVTAVYSIGPLSQTATIPPIYSIYKCAIKF